MKAVSIMVGLVIMSGVVMAEVIPLPEPINAGINIVSFDVHESLFNTDNGNWIIKTVCNYDVPAPVISEEWAEKGNAVQTRVVRVLIIVVTPAELAAAVGVPVEDLDSITNAELKAGVRTSALGQAMVMLGLQ